MTRTNRAADFIKNMEQDSPAPATEPAPPAVSETTATETPRRKPPNSRAGLKHIGGYFGDETVEKVAVLRARLRRDNSELLELAINELYRKHMAKRAFGDT